MDNGPTPKKSSYGGTDNEGFEMIEPNDEKKISSALTNSQNNNDIPSNKTTGPRKRVKVSTVSIPEEVTSPASKDVEFEDLDHDPNSVNILARLINGVRLGVYNLVVKNKPAVKVLTLVLVIVLCNAYLITAIAYNRRHGCEWDWCDGHGLLIILFCITYWCLFYYHILKRFFGKSINQSVLKPLTELGNKIFSRWYFRVLAVILVFGAVAAFIIIDAWDDSRRLISAGGAVVMVLIGFLCSRHPGRIAWRQVFGGMAVQFVFGLLVLRWAGGRSFLECVSEKVTTFLGFANEGSGFIYGYLASGNLSISGSSSDTLEKQWISFDPLFAFGALSVIYFFSFVVGLLYHLGIMTWVVMKVGWVLQVLLGTTAAESMNASANIFLGQTEAPILIKPFLNDMTPSEIHAVMTGGFATIAGSVMAAYISFGVTASSLLTASVMAAPSALACSKLIWPETQKSKTSAKDIKKMDTKPEGSNALDAASAAAGQGFILIGNIIASLIAVISFVAFLNSIIGWLGYLVGQEQLSFEWILGKIFIPFAFLLGVDSENIEDVALLLGLKTVVNEFVAYQRLLEMGTKLSRRSKMIAEFALCSFANFSSVGIQLGGLGTLAPLRRSAFSKCVWSALLAGTLTSLLNACIAGALMSGASDSELNPNGTIPILCPAS